MFLKANYSAKALTIYYRPQVRGGVFKPVERNDGEVIYESDGDSGYNSNADWEEDRRN